MNNGRQNHPTGTTKIMRTVPVIFLLLTFMSCTSRVKKEEFEKNYSHLEIEGILAEEFYALRMRNRITKKAEYNYEIVKVTDEYVYIAKTLEKGPEIYYSWILKCRRKELEEKFPHFLSFDGVTAEKIISENTAAYKPKFDSQLKTDYEWVPELKNSYYIFHLRWNYSADEGPIIKRTFDIRVSKNNINDVDVIPTSGAY